jgi:hypothetical protein
MRRLLCLLLLLLAVALTSPPAGAEPTDIAATARSVVRVVLIGQEGQELSLVGHGSGVAIGPNLILTNAHVVEPAQQDDSMRIGVVPSEGKSGWFAKIIAVSPGNDLALVQLTEPGSLPVATLYVGAVSDGEDVYAVGYPGNVDAAQGLNIGEMVSPTSPVKTRGSISSGRSSKQFDTLLHTAPIGAGNSGGPLLDDCGRVIGINSFGTVAQEADSAFYFAVSMREVTRFLLNAHVKPQTTGAPCRSLADFSRSEAEHAAAEKQRADEAAQIAAVASEKARREAQLEVIGARENGMALTGFALFLALATGGVGVFLLQKQRKRDTAIAAVLTAGLLAGAVAAWVTRPSLAEIDTRAEDMLQASEKGHKPKPLPKPLAGNLVCVLDLQRSRVTVSSTADMTVNWGEDGCADTHNQFASGAEGWFRVSVPNDDETVTVSSFDPTTGVYKAERYLLDYDAMTRLRAERDKLAPLQCGASSRAAQELGSGQMSLKSMLPEGPNERLVYNCSKANAQE